ncbi:amino acid synthesis family protein [Streptomyces sp. NA02950]|uniref:amino acid synthesis family protein n=1 Tax=Streptomyces sp. NA02950 TaxID=2742137 RepID=UPI00158FE3EE|nr:amino acid synthesis family protein [Streptomyces sp. NA02950]QKV93084.1 amino acid synthesis family protein [Streptomyces sp. NA02950]
MPDPNFAGYHIRKWYTQIEDTLANETGTLADGEPVRKIVIAAAVHNPYAGRFSENLDLIIADSPKLGEEFGRRITEVAAGRPIESYGKACLVGTNGEYEHGNAFLTAVFAHPVRDAVGGGKSWVPSTGKRGAPGTAIDVPLAHKDALYVRSHYDTVTLTFTDTPDPDEVVVIFAFATRGRLHARLGGIKADEIQGQDGLH